MVLRQGGFGIECVDLRGTPIHEQVYYSLGAGGELGSARGQRQAGRARTEGGGCGQVFVGRQKVGQGQQPKTLPCLSQQFSPGGPYTLG